MPEDAAHVLRTLDDLKKQLVVKIDETRDLLNAVNMLEGMTGLIKTELGDLLGLGRVATQTQNGGRRAAPIQVRPDEYLGMEALEAAKKYIAAVGHAVHMDEITEAVSRGGIASRDADWREKLEKSLTRSVYDVLKVQEKTFGLKDFYTEEQVRRLRGTRRISKRGEKPKGKRRGRPPKAKPEMQSSAPEHRTARAERKTSEEKKAANE